MEELKQLVKEGKIRYIGLLEANADTKESTRSSSYYCIANKVFLVVYKLKYFLLIVHLVTFYSSWFDILFANSFKFAFNRICDWELLCTCRELGIGIVAYSLLSRGFFSGKSVVEACLARACWYAASYK